jgi:ectoine hydroxylase-related dioxygenase (phytanoyl-CoA dioxygenase family)
MAAIATVPPVQNPFTEADVETFQRDGIVCLRGAFGPDWLEALARGVAWNERHPSRYGGDSVSGDETGRFFDDYCNWPHIPEYRDFVLRSPAAEIAARLMRSETARIFHEHVLIKEPGTSKATPWHHDLPYYNVMGEQTVSIWLALDPVDRATCPEFVAGSHLWGRLYYPRKFRTMANYDYAGTGYETVPDIDADRDRYDIRSWALEPGDALCFSYKALHGAPPNRSANRRRGFSTRWLGDDARYAVRPGETSPPYHDLGLADGDPLPQGLFPTVWPRPAPKDAPAPTV